MDVRPTDKRRHARYLVTTSSPCQVTFDEAATPIEIVNLSTSGLCIFTPRRIPESEEVVVSVAGVEFRARRVWHYPESFDPLRYKTGLVRIDEGDDFVAAAQQAPVSLVATLD